MLDSQVKQEAALIHLVENAPVGSLRESVNTLMPLHQVTGTRTSTRKRSGPARVKGGRLVPRH